MEKKLARKINENLKTGQCFIEIIPGSKRKTWNFQQNVISQWNVIAFTTYEKRINVFMLELIERLKIKNWTLYVGLGHGSIVKQIRRTFV